MSSFIPYQSIVGISASFGSLALALLVSFFHRDFSRSLVTVQMLYLFLNVYDTGDSIFSTNLSQSWLGFMPSILTYCNSTSYECNNANLITVVVVWAAFIVALWIIVRIVAIKKPNASFQPFYSFFKGIFRWTSVPLFYNSMVVLQQRLQAQEYHRDYYAALLFLLFYGFVVLVELIGYKCCEYEGENSWKKWIQFWGQIKLGCYLTLVSVSVTVNIVAKYILYAPLIFYDIFHLIKYDYHFKVVERIIFILQQSIFITIYSIFVLKPTYILPYNLDFFAAAAIIILEILHLIMRIYSFCKLKGPQSSAVKNEGLDDTPLPSKDPSSLKRQKSLAAIKMTNSYIVDADTSLAEINASTSSPRKPNRGRLV